MQPVTISRLQLPSVLCRAISRMVSIDSCFAESMNAQVLTISTSASPASCVSSWPPCCASPSITSESTRFFGQPRETSPTFTCNRILDIINTQPNMSINERIAISSILTGKVPAGAGVTVRGWVRTRRDSKAGLSFLHVHDGSCFDPLQIVAPAGLPNYESEIKRLTSGCSVIATGTVAASQGQAQAVELQADAIEVVGWVDDPDTYPIQPKKTSFEYLREVAHLRPRTNTIGAVARVRHALSMAMHRYYHERGFLWVHTPIITASDAEGAGEMFRVSTLDFVNRDAMPRTPDGRTDFTQDFFGREAFLTVSGQLNVETYCC